MKVEESALFKICKSAEAYPQRIAYQDKDKKYTYCELISICQKISVFVSEESFPVIVFGTRSANMLFAMLACYVAGITYVPIEKGTPHERISEIISQTGAKTILCAENECQEFKNFRVLYIKDLIASPQISLKVNFKDFNENRNVYIIFTSGSTGNPKGVPINEKNLASFTSWIGKLYSAPEYNGINILGTASFAFDLSVADIYLSLCFGNTLISVAENQKKNVGIMCEIFSSNKINLAVMTPTFARLCLLDKSFNHNNLPNLKSLFLCGETLDKKTAQKLLNAFPKLSLINAYGPTEATCAVLATEITQEHINSPLPLPIGKIGSCACNIEISESVIELHGNSVFSGYIEKENGGHYIKNGENYYITGDLGYVCNGFLYCDGRCDDQIKFHGYRIELSEIESKLTQICGVQACAVVAKRGENGEVKQIRAYICSEDKELTKETILSELSQKLPRYMMPQIIFMSQLPTNINGKTDRKKLCNM